MNVSWSVTSDSKEIFEGKDRKTNEVKWIATPTDLIFGSNSELRSLV
ncbi:MAG: hypothetical protein ACKO6J_06760 [Crocinitomicaceae bacterium]